MKLQIAFGLLALAPLWVFSQVLVLKNGHKIREFWEGNHVEIQKCASCDPDILNDCVGNFDLFDGVLHRVNGDSLVLLANSIKKYRMLNGSSTQVESYRFKDEALRMEFAKDQIDLIKKSSPPAKESLRRVGAFAGCVLLTVGIGDYLTAATDADSRLSDKLQSPLTNAAILTGGLGLFQFYRKKYYLSPLLKGSESKQVWNVK